MKAIRILELIWLTPGPQSINNLKTKKPVNVLYYTSLVKFDFPHCGSESKIKDHLSAGFGRLARPFTLELELR
jgi:hypothetical protein